MFPPHSPSGKSEPEVDADWDFGPDPSYTRVESQYVERRDTSAYRKRFFPFAFVCSIVVATALAWLISWAIATISFL